tara:strand:+ start:212 stop:598 length:387 start_codon:yes stop_codon:yes gene_type:complete
MVSFFKKVFLCFQVTILMICLRARLTFFGFKNLLDSHECGKWKFVFNDNLNWNIKSVTLVSKIVPKCSCLVKSFALKVVSSSVDKIRLVVGVAKANEFQSHAWIEIDQKIIFGELKNQKEFKPILILE